MAATSPTSPAPEAEPVKALLISTERSVRLKRPGAKPKLDYDTRKPREIVTRLSEDSRRAKIDRFANMDMTPMRHEDFAYVTLHFPTAHCFTSYAVTPEMVKAAWKKMSDWLGKNVLNPITGKKTFFWNLEYQYTHCPHYSMGLVIPVSMEKKMIAQWRKAVGHPASVADDDVIHFSRKDPRFSSPEAVATYMAEPKGHQEIAPTEWTKQGWNPPGFWGAPGMKTLLKTVHKIVGAENIRAVNERMREVSEKKVIEFVNPKTGEICESFRNSWNVDSPKGSSEIRNFGDGLLIHDELVELYGSEDTPN